jgi:hypothetical protein
MPEKGLILMATSFTALAAFYCAKDLSFMRNDLRNIAWKVDTLHNRAHIKEERPK